MLKRAKKKFPISQKNIDECLPYYDNAISLAFQALDWFNEIKKDLEQLIRFCQPPCDYGCEDEEEFWSDKFETLWTQIITFQQNWFGDNDET